jgi:hypothetical protein
MGQTHIEKKFRKTSSSKKIAKNICYPFAFSFLKVNFEFQNLSIHSSTLSGPERSKIISLRALKQRKLFSSKEGWNLQDRLVPLKPCPCNDG